MTHRAAAQHKPKLLLILPALMMLWANMHGGFFVGYMVIGAYLAEAAWRKNISLAWKLLLALVACVAATLINPLGLAIFEACNRTLTSSLLPIISEWQPLQFSVKYFMYTGYVVLFLVTFNPLNAKVGLAEKILSLLWAAAALRHERNLPLFVILSAPAFALNLQYFISRLPVPVQKFLSLKDSEYEKDLSNTAVKSFTFACAVLLIVLLAGGYGKPFIDLRLPAMHPVEEAAYVKDHYKKLRVLNDYFQGGYLLHVWQDTSRIFIDGRAETAYPPGVVKDYLNFYFSTPGWEKMLDKYRIDAALIPVTQENQNAFFASSAQWRKAYAGRMDTLYIRKPR